MVDRPGLGPRVGYDFNVDHLFLGGHLNLPVGRRWAPVPSGEFYPGQTGSLFRLNADLKYHPRTVYALIYFGAGIAYLPARGASGVGASLLACRGGRRSPP